ncbi:DnaJ-domain-containing protein [Mytilinidion resinicola]|uniref:DnaJ-domain-containing protein n=1 Tax=Mytilinidion resinicola TaxID=574789 RepID=A0A6A6YEM8_9PEZI|nr:DnaJ-domain-containing protein [Mytilinidion resinicola]KAF2806307.1 DnaJ-domain-containing protein [Mytilinidion resinicola]
MIIIMPSLLNPYATLGVSHSADENGIRSAYHRLALPHHPDKVRYQKERSHSEGKFKDIQNAYDLLSIDMERAKLNHVLEFLNSIRDTDTPCNEQGKPTLPIVDLQVEERKASEFRETAAAVFARATETKEKAQEAAEDAGCEVRKGTYTGHPKNHRYLHPRKGTAEYRAHAAATAAAYGKAKQVAMIASLYEHYQAPRPLGARKYYQPLYQSRWCDHDTDSSRGDSIVAHHADINATNQQEADARQRRYGILRSMHVLKPIADIKALQETDFSPLFLQAPLYDVPFTANTPDAKALPAPWDGNLEADHLTSSYQCKAMVIGDRANGEMNGNTICQWKRSHLSTMPAFDLRVREPIVGRKNRLSIQYIDIWRR